MSIILVVTLTTVFCGCSTINNSVNKDKLQQAVSEKIIRFHVLANSDSSNDQKLKQKVKDEIIKYILPKLKNSQSLEETRNILKEKDEDIVKIALKVIKAEGFNYKVKSQLSRENFPVKRYGTVVLPQGEYEAYRIIIGEGKGQNWWCVMFPPLCFIDIAKGEVAEEETEEQMKKHLSKEEYESIKQDSIPASVNKEPNNKPKDNSSKSKIDNNKTVDSKEKKDSHRPTLKEKFLKMVNSEDNKEKDIKEIKKEKQEDTIKLDKFNPSKENSNEIKLEFKIVEIFKKIFP